MRVRDDEDKKMEKRREYRKICERRGGESGAHPEVDQLQEMMPAPRRRAMQAP